MTTPVLGLFQGIITSKEYIGIYLDALDDHQSFRLKNSVEHGKSEDIEQTISTLLMKPDSRILGLKLLNKFLEQCNIEMLEPKANLWLTLSLKACNARELSQPGPIFEALTQLSTKIQLSSDLTKIFSNNHLVKIYESLVNVPPSGYIAALRCIETCLRLYPGPSGTTRSVVDRFLSRFIDTTNEEISYYSGKCQHLLLQVRGGGLQGTTYKNQWFNYQKDLTGSLHSLLDIAFANCVEVGDDTLPAVHVQLNLPALKLSNEPVRRSVEIYVRFRNLVNYFVTALQDPFPTEKQILPKKILKLISRGLAITCPILNKNPIIDNLAISTLLPKFHFQLMKLLRVLIITLRTHLRTQCKLILNLLVHTLNWTSSKVCNGATKPFIKLRETTYELISLWCRVMRGGSCCEVIADALVTDIFNDISPFRSEFTLQVLSGTRKHMSKKARRQLHKAQNEQSRFNQAHSSDTALRKENLSDKGNRTLCIAALRCLQELVLSTSNFLKAPLIKIIQNKVVELSGLFYEFPLKPSQLYSSWRCRMEIYQCLNVLLIAPHSMCPPPTQIILGILQNANMRDNSVQVRQQCADILLSLEKFVHPQKEGLMFPIEHREIRNVFIKLRKEYLLQKDCLQTQPSDCDEVSETECDLNNSKDETADMVEEEVRLIGVSNAVDANRGSLTELDVPDKLQAKSRDIEMPQISTGLQASCASEEMNSNPLEIVPSNSETNGSSENGIASELIEVDIVPPAHKRSKLSTDIMNGVDNPAQDNKVVGSSSDDDDVAMLADMEASFVDELNEI